MVVAMSHSAVISLRALAVVAAGLALSPACGGDDAGGGGGDGSCELVGSAHELPASTDFAVERVSDGFVVVIDDDEAGVGTWRVDASGLGERVDVAGASTEGQPHLDAGPQGTVLGVVPWNWLPNSSFTHHTTTDGVTWTASDSVSLDGAPTFGTKSHDLAVASDGTVALVWTAGVSSVALSVLSIATDAAVTWGTLDAEVSEFSGEVNAAFAGGVLQVAAVVRDTDAAELKSFAFEPGSGFEAARDIGPTPGLLGNTEVTSIAATDDGAAWAFETRGADIDIEDGSRINGATRGYRLGADGEWTEVGRVADGRFVANWNAAAPIDGGRAAVAVAYGENNFDAAQSNDSVDLHLCDGSGCSRAVRLSGVNGTFYGPVAVAADGTEGMAVFLAEGKRGGAERVIAQGFRCP